MRFDSYCGRDARCLIDGTLTKMKEVVARTIVLVKHPRSVISDKSRGEMNAGHQIEHSHV